MSKSEAPLVIHAGYPKTATTTFQQHVFPHHPELEYLGKMIPSFRYTDDRLYPLIDELMHRSNLYKPNLEPLRELVYSIRARTQRKVILLSSESFIHPSVIDIALVADRIKETFERCKVLITIREQISAIMSFYLSHGRYAQYLSIGPKYTDHKLTYPIPFENWVSYQQSSASKNYLGTLKYYDVISYYVSLFGPENIHVLMYENLRADPVDYVSRLSRVLQVDPVLMTSLLKGKHEMGSDQAAWFQASTNTFLQKMRDRFSQRLTACKSDFSHDVIGHLREEYRDGNKKLSKWLSIPLKEYGYAV